MSTLDKDLVLYLKLNEISGGRVLDSSGKNHHGQLHGAPMLAEADLFGACLTFDGVDDFVQVDNSPDFNFTKSQDFTVEAWVLPDPTQADVKFVDNEIVAKWSGTGGFPFVLRYNNQTDGASAGLILAARFDSTANPHVATTSTFPGTEFHHIALVKSGATGRIYVDTQAQSAFADTTTATTENDSPLFLASRGGQTNFFKGRIANLRIYKRALSPAELQQDREEDLTAAAAFRKTHPLSFSLAQEGDENVVYIEDDPTQQILEVRLRNDSRHKITFSSTSGSVSSQNSHVELRFRPRTLAQRSVSQAQLASTALSQGWTLATRTLAGFDSLFLLNSAQLTLSPSQEVTVPMLHIGADPTDGSRGTSVLMQFSALSLEGQTQMVSGQRVLPINVVNHRGRKDIPLHFGPAGGNTILNDGEAKNQLQFRVINVTPTDAINPERSAVFFIAKAADPIGYTRISLSVDIGTEDWSLFRPGEAVPAVSVTGWVPENGGTQVPGVFEFHPDSVTSLAAGKALQITMSDVISSTGSGLAQVYLHYRNVPGYFDGQLVTIVEKSPIIVTAPARNLDIRPQNCVVQISESKGVLVTGSNNGSGMYFGVPSQNDPNQATAAIETSWGGGTNPQVAIGVTREFSRAGSPNGNLVMDFAGNIALRQGSSSRLIVNGSGGVEVSLDLAVHGAGHVTGQLTVEGSIRIPGAGIGTPTSAFIHEVTAANIDSRFNNYTVIDNPFTNNDVNAILLVTTVVRPRQSSPPPGQHGPFQPIFIDFDTGLGRWRIGQLENMIPGSHYNVLVIKQ